MNILEEHPNLRYDVQQAYKDTYRHWKCPTAAEQGQTMCGGRFKLLDERRLIALLRSLEDGDGWECSA
jgi:hypothetical protein